MVLALGPGEGLGLLQPIVDAARARRVGVRVLVETRSVHGDPAEYAVDLSRGTVEASWDLGPLLAWTPARDGWILEDSTTLCRLHLAGTVEVRALVPGRPRLGHAADDPRLQALSSDVHAAEEAARLARTDWDPPRRPTSYAEVTHLARRVETEEPAAAVRDRLVDLLSQAVAGPPTPASLPSWLREATAPPADSPDAVRRRAACIEARGRRARRLAWELRWTPEEVVRHLTPAERLWRWHGARVVDDHTLDVAVRVAAPWAPTTSLKWLLAAAGASACRPGVPAADLGFGWGAPLGS